MISAASVVNGYLSILGRVPRLEEVDEYCAVFAASGTEDTEEFQRILFESDEFKKRRRFLASRTPGDRIDLGQRRLAFIHIEKCGGSTLHEMLLTQFAADELCPERIDGLLHCTISEMARFRLFSGHFGLAACRSIPSRDLQIITLLREPKSRLMSFYHFQKAHVPEPTRDYRNLTVLARAHGPEEFFSHPDVVAHPAIRDAMVGALSSWTVPAHHLGMLPRLSPDDLVMSDPERACETAFAELSGLAAFGLLERFEDSRLVFNQALSMDMPAVAPRQVLSDIIRERSEMRPVERRPMTERLDHLLDALTVADRKLYERATNLFEARFRAT